MTEEEAKAKRCCGPEGCGERNHQDLTRQDQQFAIMLLPRFCIGSACMAWRERYGGVGNDAHRQGFCGLAGEP